jgi:hypothetical protein
MYTLIATANSTASIHRLGSPSSSLGIGIGVTITPPPLEMEGYVAPSGSSTCIEIPNNGPTFVA